MRFRSRTVYVDAVQFTRSNWSESVWLSNGEIAHLDASGNISAYGNKLGIKIPTSKPGVYVLAGEGDWIVKDAEGKIYPVSSENFEKQFIVCNQI